MKLSLPHVRGFGPQSQPPLSRGRLLQVYRRLVRAYRRHRKDVMYVDPLVGRALVAEGLCDLLRPQDYDAALDAGRELPFDPRYHYPVRLRRIATAVPRRRFVPRRIA